MKYKYSLIVVLLFIIVGNSYSQESVQEAYPFQPVTFNLVKINDQFWSPRIETYREVTIPYYAWDHRGNSTMTVWIPEK